MIMADSCPWDRVACQEGLPYVKCLYSVSFTALYIHAPPALACTKYRTPATSTYAGFDTVGRYPAAYAASSFWDACAREDAVKITPAVSNAADQARSRSSPPVGRVTPFQCVWLMTSS